MLAPFAQRVRTSRAWTALALRAPRGLLAVALALLPGLALVAAAILWPALTEPERVRGAFARYISGLITAATIAVGFATLSLRRGLKGLGELAEHVEADRAFADRVAQLTSRRAPTGVGPTLAVVLEAAATRAREVRATEIAEHVDHVARRVREAGGDPDRLLMAALELDAERAVEAAHAEVRDERLAALLETADIARSYVKTLAMQWGLSRMSQAIALTSIGAVVVATGVVLAYEPAPLAPFVLGAALAAVLMPLCVFVSFALRATFVNQHTLPIGHFVLGPENPEAVAPAGGRPGRRGPAGHR